MTTIHFRNERSVGNGIAVAHAERVMMGTARSRAFVHPKAILAASVASQVLPRRRLSASSRAA
jgi:hypothetical protein